MKVTIFSGLALAVGCGGDDSGNKNPDQAAPTHDMAMSSNNDGMMMMGGNVWDNSKPTVNMSGLALVPEIAWATTMTPPFAPAGEMITWYNWQGAPTTAVVAGSGMMPPTWSLKAEQNTMVAPQYVASAFALPTISDTYTVASADQGGIAAHAFLKTSTTSGNNAVTTVLPSVGGPNQATLLAQGVCILEALKSHDSNVPVAVYASATVSSGFDIYTIKGDPTSGNVTVTTGGAGVSPANDPTPPPMGASQPLGQARFLITKNGNTTVSTATVNFTDQSGQGFTWTPRTCDVTPGYVVFHPEVHD